ncbi:hypothetical protein [Thiorhodospira sibirica]|uniref:hypothetical protein n=1 Tax=Thiorhodospira sibirica TaxID=154347 RepID=UPI001C8DE171|nr:hypothetical protein [Thiorhodospira sibirica]
MALRFVPAETTQVYMETLQQYLDQHGRPVALYSDKHSIFRVNHPEHDGELTQFSRALKTLDIAAIHANTPQAKGRWSGPTRPCKTVWSRSCACVRSRTSTPPTPSSPTFMADFNARFAVEPQSPQDAHRPVLHSLEEQALILCMHHTCKLSKNLCFQFKNREYQLQGQGKGYRLRGATLTVCEAFDGTITLLHQGHIMPYRLLAEGEPPTPLDDEKSVHHSVDQAKAKQTAKPTYKPAPDHPWRGRGNITPAPAQTP